LSTIGDGDVDKDWDWHDVAVWGREGHKTRGLALIEDAEQVRALNYFDME
jgi:hypothetical protein